MDKHTPSTYKYIFIKRIIKRLKYNTMTKKRNQEEMEDAEQRDRLIINAIVSAGDRETKQRIVEAMPKLPRNRRVKLDYENTVQREARGRMVKFLREKMGITQKEFSILVGTNRSYVGQVEKGLIDISCAALDYWCSRCGGRLMVIPF